MPVGLRLFLPEKWTDDPVRCVQAGVPEATMARAEALLRRERQGGPAANMDEVVWLWETAKRIRREAPEPVRISVAAEEANALWREAGAMLHRLTAADGTHEEWSAVYHLLLSCDVLAPGDQTV